MRSDEKAEIAVLRSEVADLERAEGAARRTFARFAWLNILLLVGVAAYAVSVLGMTGLAVAGLAGLILVAPGWLALWLKYRDARVARRLRQRDLEALLGQSAAPEQLSQGSTGPA